MHFPPRYLLILLAASSPYFLQDSAADLSPLMHYVHISDANVAYSKDGQGPGLILLHGTGGNAANNWGHLIDHFTPDYTVLRPEYSGSGSTTDNGGPLSLPMIAAQIIAVADAEQLDTFDLIGFSLGASVAAYIAAEYPQRVRSIVLLAGFIHGTDSRMQVQFDLWHTLIDTDLHAMARLVLLNGFSPNYLSAMSQQQVDELIEIIVETNWWQGMKRQIDLNLTVDIRDQIQRIHCPALIVGCTYDHIVPLADSHQLAQTIAGARYTELPSGHLAIIELGEPFAELAKQFLTDLRTPQPGEP